MVMVQLILLHKPNKKVKSEKMINYNLFLKPNKMFVVTTEYSFRIYGEVQLAHAASER
jgi:hypothetical protein